MAFGVMAILTRGRLEWRRGVSLVVIAGLMVALAAVVADVPALAEKLGRSASGLQGRLRIWRDTLPVVRDFWLAGTGGGTYRTAMLYYQRSYREVQFNQAHNHYLQAAAEGGVLLIAPLMCALFALARRIRVKLASDHSGTYWIRAGAATGLLAVALQSLWETGLVLPANAALAAVLAAIAVHDRKV
jgi:O-antigen ligase